MVRDTVPKPTAKIEMPAAFTVFATVYGLPPAVFSPSLSSTIVRGWFVADMRLFMPVIRPAPIFVMPEVE